MLECLSSLTDMSSSFSFPNYLFIRTNWFFSAQALLNKEKEKLGECTLLVNFLVLDSGFWVLGSVSKQFPDDILPDHKNVHPDRTLHCGFLLI